MPQYAFDYPVDMKKVSHEFFGWPYDEEKLPSYVFE
jgi:hypothetical protein